MRILLWVTIPVVCDRGMVSSGISSHVLVMVLNFSQEPKVRSLITPPMAYIICALYPRKKDRRGVRMEASYSSLPTIYVVAIVSPSSLPPTMYNPLDVIQSLLPVGISLVCVSSSWVSPVTLYLRILFSRSMGKYTESGFPTFAKTVYISRIYLSMSSLKSK